MAEENQNRDRDSRFKTICLWNSQSSRRDIREINNLMDVGLYLLKWQAKASAS